MIEIPKSQNYEINSRKSKGENYPCVVCGKAIRNWIYSVRLIKGGAFIGTEVEAQEEPAGDLGAYPIGPDCLKKHPELKEYVSKEAESRE